MKSIDLCAKLLATENITVTRSNVSTASFDVKSRVLTLPIFKDITNTIESMLVAHEVGHALYTPQSMLDKCNDLDIPFGYINILEDVRIEKLIKRKYPGLRKEMAQGYKEINELDFFEIANKDINSFNLIDRINIWYKVGLGSKVSFSKKEKTFLERIDRLETSDEVIDLAKEIYYWSKKFTQKKGNFFISLDDLIFNEDIDSLLDTIEVTVQSDDTFSNPASTASVDTLDVSSGEFQKTEEQINKELESKTDSALSESIKNLSDNSIKYEYVTLSDKFHKDFVKPYKTILSEIEHVISSKTNPFPLENYNTFKINLDRSISFLLKEFEMRKAADRYKRTTVSKSGSLDVSKIWAYQLNDDLFKRISIVKDGKNHGLIFLLDWSGSMSKVIHDTIEQVITLSAFCHKAQIPFHVYAFTSICSRAKYEYDRSVKLDENELDNTKSCTLMEFFNHKMSNREFNQMSKALFHTSQVIIQQDYQLYATPLNEALAYIALKLGDLILMNNVEKTTVVTLTDGEGHTLNSNNRHSSFYFKNVIKTFLKDDKTKINYSFDADATHQSTALLNMIRDRYQCKIISYYIGGTKPGDIMTGCRYNGISVINVDDIRKEIRDNSFAKFSSPARDEFVYISSKSLKIDEDEDFSINEKQSAKSIAKTFTKALEKRSVNRPLLTNFIQHIA